MEMAYQNNMVNTFDTTNKEQMNALEMISRTRTSFFLTGRAGTGKTTFLKNVLNTVDKNFVVLAPTGVAAVNAGGQTIHSFFGFHLGVLMPLEVGTMRGEKISLLRHTDTIIVDEVSMVRCDVIDAMDRTLRYYRRNSAPFGGVQMIFIGDLFQLEPVVVSEERSTLEEIYGKGSFNFYNSRVLRDSPMVKIEFRKIYRQNDQSFIDLLEKVRTGNMSYNDLKKINSRVVTPGNNSKSENGSEEENKSSMNITLTSLRKDAQAINDAHLKELKTKAFTYEASYHNDSSKCKDIVDQNLVLKEGAQVMFIKNGQGKPWVNGTLAVVSHLEEDSIEVTLDDGQTVSVPKETWESVEYKYDKSSGKMETNVIGSVSQYPLRLAWAITIHKSQSLTFKNVTIDFGRRAFSCGQAYVALSRCCSLEGLTLLRPMTSTSVMVSKDVQDFTEDFNDEDLMQKELTIADAIAQLEKNSDYDAIASRLFDLSAEYACKGDESLSCELMTKAMSYVIDDACLFGKRWTKQPWLTARGVVCNAIGLFYSGNKILAESMLRSIDYTLDNHFDGLYILSRCIENKDDWTELESIYMRMIRVYGSYMEKGIDSPSFRKFKYRLGILNENHYGDPGASLIRELIFENQYYDKCHSTMRAMLFKHSDVIAKSVKNYNENPIVSALVNSKITEDSFMDLIRKERTAYSESWKEYRMFLANLSLERPC